ncbi:predicted protein [Postia placenta Mad-698-R]|nr:predicted protein [Postia placenta Mad-698-R]
MTGSGGGAVINTEACHYPMGPLVRANAYLVPSSGSVSPSRIHTHEKTLSITGRGGDANPHLDQQTLFVIIDRPASLKASYDVGNRASMPSVPPIRIRAPAIASALSNSKNCTHIYLDPTTYIPVVNTLAQVATTADPLSPVLVRKDRSLVFWQYEHHSIAQDVTETYHKIRHYARTYDCDKVTPRSVSSPYALSYVGKQYASGSNTQVAQRQVLNIPRTPSVPHATSSGPPMVGQNSGTNRYGIGYSSDNTTSVSSSVSAQHITWFDDETVTVDEIDGSSPHRTKRSRTSASVTPFSTSFCSATLPVTSPTSIWPPSTSPAAWQPAPRPDKGKQRATPREDESGTSSPSPSLRRGPQHVQPSRGRKRKTRHDDDADTSGPSHKRIAVSLSYTESSASPTPSQESAASPAASQGSAASSTSSQGSIADDLMCSACSKTFGRKDTKTRHLKRVLSCPLSQKLTVPCPHCGTHLTRDLPRHNCDEKKAYMEDQLQHKRA